MSEVETGEQVSLGQRAFEAYNRVRGGVNYRGDRTPDWPDLPGEIRHAWECAAWACVEVGQVGLVIAPTDDEGCVVQDSSPRLRAATFTRRALDALGAPRVFAGSTEEELAHARWVARLRLDEALLWLTKARDEDP